MPPMNSLPTDAPEDTPYKIMAMPGGISMARVLDAVMQPMALSGSYPWSHSAGYKIMPMATMAAGPAPEMAPKMVQVTTVVMARPPGRWPTRRLAKFTSLWPMSPLDIMSAAYMKNGMDSRENVSMPPTMRWMARPMSMPGKLMGSATRQATTMDMKMGTPSTSSTKNRTPQMANMPLPPLLFPEQPFSSKGCPVCADTHNSSKRIRCRWTDRSPRWEWRWRCWCCRLQTA